MSIGNCLCDTRDQHPASECVPPSWSAEDVQHSDVRELLTVLGLGDHARPYSPHAVIHREILPVLRAMQSEGSDLCDCGHPVDRHEDTCQQWVLVPSLAQCMCEYARVTR